MKYLRILLREEYIRFGFKEIVKKFNQNHNNIRIRLLPGPSSIDERRKVCESDLLSRRGVFDIMYLDAGWIPDWVKKGFLVPLDNLIGKEIWDRFKQRDVDRYVWNGIKWAVPCELDAGILFYRKDLLEKAGFSYPKTFDDVIHISKKLQHPPSLWGYTWQGALYEGLTVHFLELLWGSGGEWLDLHKKVCSHKIYKARHVLTFWKHCLSAKGISPRKVLNFKEFDSGTHFLNGHAIFHRNWPALYVWAQKKDSPVKGKIGFCPMIHMKGMKGFSVRGGLGFGISTLSKRKKVAVEFIQFCTNKCNQKELHHSLGIIPANRRVVVKSGNSDLKRLYAIIKTARARPQLSNYAGCSQVLQKNIRAFLKGELTIRQVLNNIKNQIEMIVR